jgi:hypothetical protein
MKSKGSNLLLDFNRKQLLGDEGRSSILFIQKFTCSEKIILPVRYL